MAATAQDRRVLRELATRVRDLAARPEMADRRAACEARNALRPAPPAISVSPEGCWPELLPIDDCVCGDPLLRQWELALRRRLYLAEVIRDDSVVEPTFDVPWVIDRGSLGVTIPRTQGDRRGSFVWDPPIKDLDADFDKLRPREPRVDRQATAERVELAGDLFGDLLEARVHGIPLWSVGMTQDAAYLVGIEQLMFAMFDNPAGVRRLMRFLRDDMARFLDFVEREQLLRPNHRVNHVGSGGGGYVAALDRDEGQSIGWSDAWGFCESQETVGVSPGMFSDFVLPYQAPLTERFGLNYYGCCEELEHRLDAVIGAIPRLRRVSVSPKADQAAIAAKLAGRFVFCRKADPVPVCVTFNEDAIRRDVRHTLEVAGDGPLEVILKDTHTVRDEPWRVRRWVELARDEVARFTGRGD